MSARWVPGVWLGKRWEPDEHIVHDDDHGLIKCRAVTMMAREDETWDLAWAMSVRGVPWQWKPNDSHLDEHQPGAGAPPAAPEAEAPLAEQPLSQDRKIAPRSFRITNSILERHGFTPGCPKCTELSGGPNYDT